MKKFDLEKALAGEPFQCKRTKHKFYYLGDASKFGSELIFPIVLYNATADKTINIAIEHFIDENYGMYEELRPTVTLTLPAPITYPEENKRCYTIVINDVDAYDGDGSFVSISDWVAEKENGDYDYQTKQRIMEGLLFATEEDAQAWLDALKNARR